MAAAAMFAQLGLESVVAVTTGAWNAAISRSLERVHEKTLRALSSIALRPPSHGFNMMTSTLPYGEV